MTTLFSFRLEFGVKSGVFFKCLRGDNQNLAVPEPCSFVIHDGQGSNWLCHPLSSEAVETLSLREHIADVKQADAALKEHGLAESGTEVRVYCCQDEADLRSRLVKS